MTSLSSSIHSSSPQERRISAPHTPVLPTALQSLRRVNSAVSPSSSPAMVTSFPIPGGRKPHPNARNVPDLKVDMSQPGRSRRVFMTNPADPATQKPCMEAPRSLVGFDPLLLSTPSPRYSLDVPPLSPMAVAPTRPLRSIQTNWAPKAIRGIEKRHDHRKVQSFCVSGVKGIQQQAIKTQNEQFSESHEGSPRPEDGETRVPASPMKPRGTLETMKTESLSIPATAIRSDPFTNRISSTGDSSSGHNTPPTNLVGLQEGPESQKQEKRSTLTPPRSRTMPWSKSKSHRRTKSLETDELSSVTTKNLQRSSLQAAVMDRNSTIKNSFVQDLMEVNFDKLQIPTLAKPSPTSFLTGREGEVIRTCEYEAAPFQMEIPSLSELVMVARLNEFVDNYRRIDQNFDLQSWKGFIRMDLLQIDIPAHIPIAQLLLDCADDVILQGVILSGTNPDERLELAVFEGQRHFIAVFRGTTEQQLKPGGGKHKKKTDPLDSEAQHVEVYHNFLEEYKKLEKECFALLDKLTEDRPFCDVIFTGHSFGAALATLASVKFSNARAMMRVKCYPMSSPKVGLMEFRQMVNSSANLRVVRLEYGQDAKCQLPSPSGFHVGHTIVLHGSLGRSSQKTKQLVLAYKFETPKHKKFKTTHPDLRSYVAALEEIARLNLPWVKDYVGNSGKGVVVNNEARQMV